MAKLQIKFPSPDSIEFLVGRKFPLALLYRKSRPKRGSEKSEKRTEYMRQVEAYESEIKALDEESFRALLSQEKQAARAEAAAAAEKEDLDRWYNQPDAQADYDYWSRATYWHLDEAIALVLGKDPEKVTHSALKATQGYPTPPLVERFDRIKELATRAVNFEQLFTRSVPSLFIRWAEQTGIEVPEELAQAVARNSQPLTDWRAEYEKLLKSHNKMVQEANQKFDEMSREAADQASQISQLEEQIAGDSGNKLASRERSSLLKLLLVMAASKYDYRPGRKNTSTGNNKGSIASDGELLGLELDSETIRKYLKQAAEMFGDEITLPED